MRVDVHTHAQPPEYLQALIDSGRYQVERGPDDQLIIKEHGSRFLTVTPETHDPEQRVADMDAAGVDVQVLSLSIPNLNFLEGREAVEMAVLTNDYLAGIVQAYPDRFRALASVPLTADIDSAIAELARCMDVLGMPGFLIGANIAGAPIDDPRFDPFYEEANRRGAVMLIHPMIPPGIEAMNQYALAPLVGFMFDTTLAVSRLIFSNFFGRFLGVNVIAAHLGGAIPFLAGRLDTGWRTYPDCQGINRPPSEFIERLYFDTVSFHEPALRCAIETVGEDQILFGSDYPRVISNVAGSITRIEHAVSRRHRNRILGETAARLFGIA
ncbi:MAG: amidohydrolase family protein [Thermomicrobiales bacterium]